MPVPAIDIKKLENIFCEMDIAGIQYGLGAKAPYLDIDPSKIKEIDCSGFIRYALYKATNGKLTIPDGSWHQREWCEKQSLHQLASYSDVTSPITVCLLHLSSHGQMGVKVLVTYGL